jgi:hypothetical protein
VSNAKPFAMQVAGALKKHVSMQPYVCDKWLTSGEDAALQVKMQHMSTSTYTGERQLHCQR